MNAESAENKVTKFIADYAPIVNSAGANSSGPFIGRYRDLRNLIINGRPAKELVKEKLVEAFPPVREQMAIDAFNQLEDAADRYGPQTAARVPQPVNPDGGRSRRRRRRGRTTAKKGGRRRKMTSKARRY
jgi:hypothetical protein